MGTFSESTFEQKLLYLKDTHDSIASLSNWCLTHQEHHGKIVATWLNVLKRVKTEHRLLLFYLANDVIQYSRRKSLPFVDSFAPALQKATTMVREETVRNKILRLFKIWDERGIYDEGFLVDLSGLLSHGHKSASRIDVTEFQPSTLYSRIRSCKQLEDDTDAKLNILNECKIKVNEISNAAAFRNTLKHRSHGEDVVIEFEENVAKIKAYVDALEAEIKERTGLIDLLETGEQYYDKEYHEAKVVVNAYKCFASRVRGVKRKLEEKIESMPSPLPSPDINAPSPSPEPKETVSPDSTFVQDGSSPYGNLSQIEPVGDVYVPPKPKLFYNPEVPSNNYSQNNSRSQQSQLDAFVPPDASSASFLNDASFLKNSMACDFLTDFRTSDFEEGKKMEEVLPPAFLQQMPTNDSFMAPPEGNKIEVITGAERKPQLALSALLQTLIPGSPAPPPVPPPPKAEDPFGTSKFWNDRDTSWDHLSPASPTPFEEKPSFSLPFDEKSPFSLSFDEKPPFPLTFDDKPPFSFDEKPPFPPPFDEKPPFPLPFGEKPTFSLPFDDKAPFSLPFDGPVQDNDMRYSKKDVDHRNLISLTETSGSNWGPDDTDYRSLPETAPTQDNVENVDMEMSDEDEKIVECLRPEGGRILEPIEPIAAPVTVLPPPPVTLPPPLKEVAKPNPPQYFNNSRDRDQPPRLCEPPPPKSSPPPLPKSGPPAALEKSEMMKGVRNGGEGFVPPSPPHKMPPPAMPMSNLPPPPPPVPPGWPGHFPPRLGQGGYGPPQQFYRPPPPPPPPKWYPPRNQFRPNYRHFSRGGPRFDRW